MTDPTRSMRQVFADAIRAYSEDIFAAGWLVDIEKKVRTKGGVWTVLAFLAAGWPRLSDRKFTDAEGNSPNERWLSLLDWEPLTAEEEAYALRFMSRLPHVMANMKTLLEDLP